MVAQVNVKEMLLNVKKMLFDKLLVFEKLTAAVWIDMIIDQNTYWDIQFSYAVLNGN